MNEVVVKDWGRMKKRLVKTVSTSKAYEVIAHEYGVSSSSVRYWLDPKYRVRSLGAVARNRERSREYYIRPEIKSKRLEYKKQYCQQPHVKQRIAAYDLKYKRVMRGLDGLVLEHFDNNCTTFSSHDIVDIVKGRSGIRLGVGTIDNLLTKSRYFADRIVKEGNHRYAMRNT